MNDICMTFFNYLYKVFYDNQYIKYYIISNISFVINQCNYIKLNLYYKIHTIDIDIQLFIILKVLFVI